MTTSIKPYRLTPLQTNPKISHPGNTCPRSTRHGAEWRENSHSSTVSKSTHSIFKVLRFRLTHLWWWVGGTDVGPTREAQRKAGRPSVAWNLERKWANSPRGREEEQSLYLLPRRSTPALSLSEVNLQLIRKWGYTDRKVKIKPNPPPPPLQTHLLFLHWFFHSLTSFFPFCLVWQCVEKRHNSVQPVS